jgi:hypothetical protein
MLFWIVGEQGTDLRRLLPLSDQEPSPLSSPAILHCRRIGVLHLEPIGRAVANR